MGASPSVPSIEHPACGLDLAATPRLLAIRAQLEALRPALPATYRDALLAQIAGILARRQPQAATS